jgi:hypothetical protein
LIPVLAALGALVFAVDGVIWDPVFKTHPLGSVPVVFGAGLLLGAMFLYSVDAGSVTTGSPSLRLALRLTRWSVVLLAVPAIVLVPIYAKSRLTDGRQSATEVTRLMSAYSKEGDPVLCIATVNSHVFPELLQMKRRSGSRYAWSFPIPMLYAEVQADDRGFFPYRRREQAPVEERQFLDDLAEDIKNIRPPLVLIDDNLSGQRYPKGFVLKEYLRKAGFVESAMQCYRSLGEMLGYEVFVLEDIGESNGGSRITREP